MNATGTGLYCKGFFSEFYHLGTNPTNFDAEIEAVRRAILNLLNLCTPLRKVVFFVDSQSAILAVTAHVISDCFHVEETKKQFVNLCGLGNCNSIDS